MQRIHDQYTELAVVLINSGESASVARPYYQQKMLTFTIALDEDSQVSRAYHASAIPTVVFIDAQGVVQKVYVGSMSESMIQAGLAAIKVAR